MKYEELNVTDNELRNKSLIKSDNIKPCSQCGNGTHYIDYCTEQRICSEECMYKQNTWLNENCR